MKRVSFFLVLLLGSLLLIRAGGCSSDPNVEGAKLDLRNKDYDRALENLDKALSTNPDNAEAHKLKGDVYKAKAFDGGDMAQHGAYIQEMMAAYERSSQLDPTLAKEVDNQLVLAYFDEFKLGVQAYNRGTNSDNKDEFVTAASHFGNATMIFPDSASAYVNQGFSLINGGRSTDAIEPFERAIDMGDTSEDTFTLLGSLYFQEQKPEKAIPVLKKALEYHPENAELQAQLLNAYSMAGEEDQAMQQYEAAVAREPNNKIYRYNYGSLLLETERYDEAIEQLRKATEIDPDYASAQYNLGAAYVNMAVAYNEQVNAIDDDLRANRGSMSADQIKQKEAEMDRLAEQRRGLFEEAIGPLEKAKMLTEAEDGELLGICNALFQSYVQTNQMQKAEAIAECAGHDMK